MSVVVEIQEVINQYKKLNKGIDRIVVNRQLLESVDSSLSEKDDVKGNTLLGYPCTFTDNEFHRFTVQSK